MMGLPTQRGRAAWSRLIVAFICMVAMIIGCHRTADTIATLDRSKGSTERQLASVKSWQKADPGTKFGLGSAVRTAAASTAVLSLYDGSKLTLEPSTLIRFVTQASRRSRVKVDLQMGQATLEVQEQPLSVDMQVGTAMIEAHAKVRLSRAGDSTRIEVVIGSARVLTEKESLELRVGDAIDIAPDRSMLSVKDAGASNRISVGNATEAGPDAGRDFAGADPAGSTSLQDDQGGARTPGPDIVDFTANAGDTFVIHDPKPPTAVGFSQSKCAGRSVLILDPEQARPKKTDGAARVSVRVPVGTHRYVIKCLKPDGSEGERAAQGYVSVLADDGSRKLAKSPPVSNVDTDGRRYTVLYQGHLPGLAVRWPNPPEADSYILHVSSGSGERTFAAKSASTLIPSGSMSEGEHVLAFEGGGRRSRATTVTLRFDNAAPTASIASPVEGSFSQGSSVRVTGVALPGWNVSVGGVELSQDAQNRFSQEVAAPGGQRALWIRFSHPARGVHYYLRRSGQ